MAEPETDDLGGFEVQHPSLSPREDCSQPQSSVVVYSRVALSSRRPEPVLAQQYAHLRVASGEPKQRPGSANSGANPDAGFLGQPVPGQGEGNPSFVPGATLSLEKAEPLPA